MGLAFWSDLGACRSACRAWHAAVKQLPSLQEICHRVLQVEEATTGGLPSIKEAVSAVWHAAQWWDKGLSITKLPVFRARVWSACIEEVKILSAMPPGDNL